MLDAIGELWTHLQHRLHDEPGWVCWAMQTPLPTPIRSLLCDKPGQGGQLWGGQAVAASSEEEVWRVPALQGHEGAAGGWAEGDTPQGPLRELADRMGLVSSHVLYEPPPTLAGRMCLWCSTSYLYHFYIPF